MRSILLLLKFSAQSGSAVFKGVQLASMMSARLNILHVLEVEPGWEMSTMDRIAERTREAEKRFEKQFRGAMRELPAFAFNCLDGDPATVSLRFAREIGAEMIIIGCHLKPDGEPGVTRLGTMAHYILEKSECPVLVVPAKQP